MKLIKIEKEKVLEAFKSYRKDNCCNYEHIANGNYLTTYVTYVNIVDNGILWVDMFNDIEVNLNGKQYWVVTTPLIKRFNKSGDYEIKLLFELKELSKHNPTFYSFEA